MAVTTIANYLQCSLGIYGKCLILLLVWISLNQVCVSQGFICVFDFSITSVECISKQVITKQIPSEYLHIRYFGVMFTSLLI